MTQIIINLAPGVEMPMIVEGESRELPPSPELAEGTPDASQNPEDKPAAG